MKRIKMALYADPGVGKSVFASKFPKPFFVTTDGNYEWLVDFGADPNAHQEVHSWSEAKKLFKAGFEGYETVVLDLTEDLFMWCENEWCKRNGIEHPSDMAWGKGYQAPRNEFFIEISKLLSLDKHVVMLMHGESITVKNKRGVEYTTYRPTSRLPDKLLDQIEGRLRYFLRAYVASSEAEGKVVKKRYLSLVPKEDEYGIIRGVDENEIPQTIPLDFDIFWNTIISGEKPVIIKEKLPKKENKKDKLIERAETVEPSESIKKEVEEENSKEIEELFNFKKDPSTESELPKEEKLAALKAKMKKEEVKEVQNKVPVEIKDDIVEENAKTLSKEEKLAALKAKMEKLKK